MNPLVIEKGTTRAAPPDGERLRMIGANGLGERSGRLSTTVDTEGPGKAPRRPSCTIHVAHMCLVCVASNAISWCVCRVIFSNAHGVSTRPRFRTAASRPASPAGWLQDGLAEDACSACDWSRDPQPNRPHWLTSSAGHGPWIHIDKPDDREQGH